MKTSHLILSLLLLFFSLASAQTIENLETIIPFHEDLAAIQKDNSWAFVNRSGVIVIPYRTDCVWNENTSTHIGNDIESINYPHFVNNRCLIQKETNGILYYGYMDTTGKVIIPPEFLNATIFVKDKAIVLKLNKEQLGTNDLLNKQIVSYSYDEVVIDSLGNTIQYVSGPEHLVFTKSRLKKRPRILSYFISDELLAIKQKNNTWKLQRIDVKE